MREPRPSSPGTPPGCRMTDDPQKESRGSQAWWTARTRSLAREVHSRLFANAAIAASRVTCSSVSGLNFLIRRSQLQILLLHNGRELVEIFEHQRNVLLELNGLCVFERRFELRQALSLFRFRDGLVAFERGDLLLDLFGRFSEFLG